MNITAEEVFDIVKRHGPIIANKIKQLLQQPDATMINVYLSTLKHEQKIRFTHLQLGTSMFAYTIEQREKLEQLIQHLNEKDRRTAQLLQEKRILRAQEQDPLTRVSLSQIKDFATPLRVETKQGEELFYKYYLVSPEEAQKKIREILTGKTTEEQIRPMRQQELAEIQKSAQETEGEKDVTQTISENNKHTKKQETKEKPALVTDQARLETQPDSEFSSEIKTYCKENNIRIQKITEVRRNSELDIIGLIPTAIGLVTFFIKAKNKKQSNDGDLASAILQAKKHFLPAIYLTTGKVTQKAQEAEELQEITVKEIGS